MRSYDGDLDFLGVNYYSRRVVRASAGDLLSLKDVRVESAAHTTTGWEVYPEGLFEVLRRVAKDYQPRALYVTENGASFDDPPAVDGQVDDPERTAYLQSHLTALARAVADGVDVRRYCVWSLLDNFEWEQGYDKRFGIVHVDFETLARVPKRSALWYRDFIARLRAGER
jgi:beta-glucosidase